MPRSDSFVRIEGNMPLEPNFGFSQQAAAKIAQQACNTRISRFPPRI
jgi:hypothetical protein